MANQYPEIDLKQVRRISFAERDTKVDVGMFGKVNLESDSFHAFFWGLPEILASKTLKELARETARCIEQGKKVVVMMGAHLIKTGVSPLFVELMRKGAFSCLVMNGAGVIHDFETALFGRTSEDVARTLETGKFGYVHETGVWINQAIQAGIAHEWGYGEAVARDLQARKPPHAEVSLLLTALNKRIPLTVHTALGTETIHQHPEANGAALGEASMRDFRILCHQLTQLEGGMVLLYGSAVVLPEVFLKALTVVRNLGHEVKRFTAVNFDMIKHYRPHENVVSRPTQSGGQGFHLIGHHELMIPLFWQGVYSLLGR